MSLKHYKTFVTITNLVTADSLESTVGYVTKLDRQQLIIIFIISVKSRTHDIATDVLF